VAATKDHGEYRTMDKGAEPLSSRFDDRLEGSRGRGGAIRGTRNFKGLATRNRSAKRCRGIFNRTRDSAPGTTTAAAKRRAVECGVCPRASRSHRRAGPRPDTGLCVSDDRSGCVQGYFFDGQLRWKPPRVSISLTESPGAGARDAPARVLKENAGRSHRRAPVAAALRSRSRVSP